MSKVINILEDLKSTISENSYNDILKLIAEACAEKVIKVEEEPREQEKEDKSPVIKKGSYKISKTPIKI